LGPCEEGTVTEDELRQLLYRRESETLDFKRDQYAFAKADEAQKAELLKDILAFANAWRSTPACILIGVDEKPQPRVVGIPEQSHLSDHELQQFVNSKTSRPILFGYQRVLYEGLHVGVLVIDHPQQRPIFLNKNHGSLKAGRVYLRRGSSTGEASPDELAAMGRAEAHALVTPRIALEFARPDAEERLGAAPEIVCTRLAIRPPRDPADAEADQQKGVQRFLDRHTLLAAGDSDEWKKQVAKVSRLAGFSRLRFWVHNGSPVTANDVNLRLEVPRVDGLEIIGESDHPRYGSQGLRAPFSAAHVRRVGANWRIDVRLQKLQPKEEDYTGEFLLRAEHPLEVDGTARIFADNLADPITLPVHLSFTVLESSIGYHDALDLWKALVR
jgi:hypothetical protein